MSEIFSKIDEKLESSELGSSGRIKKEISPRYIGKYKILIVVRKRRQTTD